MARTNLCVNPAAGTNNTGWAGGSIPARVTGLTGYSVSTGVLWTSGTFQQTPQGAASPGVQYTASVEVKSAGLPQNSKTLYLGWAGAGGAEFTTTTTVSLAADTVTRISFTGTAPAGTTGVYLLLDSVNASVANITMTAALFEAASSVGTYFDGNTPGASWNGTADNSSSTIPDASTAPNGIAIPIALGSHTVALNRTGLPTGLSIPIALGTPTASLIGASPNGINIPIGLGSHTAALNRTAAPNGLAVPIGLGSPTVIAAGQPNGLAVPIALGSPTAGPTVVSASTAGGSWYGLLTTQQQNRLYALEERRPPVACPNDGEPLLTDPRTGKLRCRYDGWIYQG